MEYEMTDEYETAVDVHEHHVAVLSERVDSLSRKVEDFRAEVRTDINSLSSAITSLGYVDQRVHDIELAAMKELVKMNYTNLSNRAESLAREVEAEKDRRATNFRLAIGALLTGLLMPMLVAFITYQALQ
jgi:hypothetical protein